MAKECMNNNVSTKKAPQLLNATQARHLCVVVEYVSF